MPFAVGTRIGPYEIQAVIGSGGMGTVYRGWDSRLNRHVAIKFLHADAADDEQGLRRFQTEARAASALNHPNILAIYDVGTADGAPYLVTEFLEGQTLTDHMRDRRQSAEAALVVARQMAAALAAAHAKGIVHRDFKPDNVFITTDGLVKVLDFGLAKQLSSLAPEAERPTAVTDAAALTRAGALLGTVGYMSPEQVRGLPADTRSDVFGLGCVLYEMLTGRRAFSRDSAVETLNAILADNPPEARLLAGIPPALSSIVSRCLEKRPEARFLSASDVVRALDAVPSQADATVPAKSLLVLPFADVSPGRDNEYFADGLSEEILADLSRVHSLRVISRTTAMSLKSTTKSVRDIASELSVTHVLEGSVRRAGNNLRITAQLVDASTDSQVWSERFSGTLEDIFDIQERVARAITDAMQVRLTAGEDRRMSKRPIASIQVYDCYLKARSAIQSFSRGPLLEAERLLQEGLQFSGENALLLAGLARVHFEHVDLGLEGEEGLADAERFARHALALDPECGPALLVLGLVEHYRGDLRAAVRLVGSAHECDPSDTDALWWLAWFRLWLTGQPDEARKLAKRHLQLDPASPMGHASMALVHLVEGRAAEAVAVLETLPRDHPLFLHMLAWALAAADRRADAIDALDPMEPGGDFDIGRYYAFFLKVALKGEPHRFSEALRPEFVRLAQLDACTAVCFTIYYTLVGEYETALDWLEKAVTRGYFNYPYLRSHDPLARPLHGHPRFERLMDVMQQKWLAFHSQLALSPPV